MNKQAYTPSGAARGVSIRVAPGHALRLGRGGGALVVLQGRVWFTRGTGAGDTGDLRLVEGQRVEVASGPDAVIEPWDAGSSVRVWWQPQPQGVLAAASALGLHAIAFVATRAAAGLAALARDAAEGARRAQGRLGDAA